MERLIHREQLTAFIRKNGYLLLVVLVGCLFMLIPPQNNDTIPKPPQTVESEKDLQDSLAEILGMISGAGKVNVLLTQAAGEEICYQVNLDRTSNEVQQDTILITDANRNETGLIKQVNPPKYLGALIVCQGADDANVRLAIVRAVMSVTGLRSDCITVLEME